MPMNDIIGSIRIDIPVVDDWVGPCTPEEINLKKRLATPRDPKSPAELKLTAEKSALLRQAHVEAVQARAARENRRADEACSRRQRAEASERQRTRDRLDAVTHRCEMKHSEKKRETHDKAALRTQRADEAKQIRAAMETARNEKLTSASDRVHDSARRAATIVRGTAAKSAHVVKHALAVVAASKEMQRQSADAAASKLRSKMLAASERRQEILEPATPPGATRMEMAHAELARLAAERQGKVLELQRSIAAATQRRESKLESRVERARADTFKVEAAHHNKAEREMAAKAELSVARKIHFTKLNDGLTQASPAGRLPPAVAFSIPLGTGPAACLPEALARRLQTKSRASPIQNGIDLATRKALSLAARVRFAAEDLAIAAAVVELQKLRAADRAERLEGNACRATRRARRQLADRAAAAAEMNARVAATSVRRSALDAAKTKAALKQSLRAEVATGRRAARLLALASDPAEESGAAIARVNREVRDAAVMARSHSLQIRELSAALAHADRMRRRSAKARDCGVPYSARHASPTNPPRAATAAPKLHTTSTPAAVTALAVTPASLAVTSFAAALAAAALGAPSIAAAALAALNNAMVARTPPKHCHVRFAPCETQPPHHLGYKTHHPKAAAELQLPQSVAFSIPVSAQRRSLPAKLTQRLGRKSQSHAVPLLSLEKRKALCAASRVAFALVDLAMVRATLALLQQRAISRAISVDQSERRGTALHQHALKLKVAVARQLNARVHAAAVRRSAADATVAKRAKYLALREVTAAGRRAGLLLAASTNRAEQRRSVWFAVRRAGIKAQTDSRAQNGRLRQLRAALGRSRELMIKSSVGYLLAAPYAVRARLLATKGSAAPKLEVPRDYGTVSRTPPPQRLLATKGSAAPKLEVPRAYGTVSRTPPPQRPTKGTASPKLVHEVPRAYGTLSRTPPPQRPPSQTSELPRSIYTARRSAVPELLRGQGARNIFTARRSAVPGLPRGQGPSIFTVRRSAVPFSSVFPDQAAPFAAALAADDNGGGEGGAPANPANRLGYKSSASPVVGLTRGGRVNPPHLSVDKSSASPVGPPRLSFETSRAQTLAAANSAFLRLGVVDPFVPSFLALPPKCERSSTDDSAVSFITEVSFLSESDVQEMLALASARVQARRSRVTPRERWCVTH